MATQQQLTAFLVDRVVADWPRQPLYPDYPFYPFVPQHQPYPAPVAHSTSPAQLAQHLLASADFHALQLGTWLQSPDGQLIAAAVEAISPPPLREDIGLLVDALTLAAASQREQNRSRAILTGIFTGAAITLAFAATRSA